MRITTMFCCYLLALAFLSPTIGLGADLKVKVSPARSNSGHLFYSLYGAEGDYNEEKNPVREESVWEASTDSTEWRISGLEPGEYSLTIFHDENDDGKHNKGWFGRPKEMFAISNITETLWNRPRWETIKFVLEEGQQEVEVDMLLKWQ